jgi:hypothetical protein
VCLAFQKDKNKSKEKPFLPAQHFHLISLFLSQNKLFTQKSQNAKSEILSFPRIKSFRVAGKNQKGFKGEKR